ncbi:MAG: hypothetical protein HRT63_13200, partial [Erythrobacter sp.]|nr:hypothetical protein [Erythrobacter sp.]
MFRNTIFAGFAYGLARELSPEHCFALANYCGAQSVKQHGPADISLASAR